MRCERVSYCNEEHQKAHWIYHKVFCKPTNERERLKVKMAGGITSIQNLDDVVCFAEKKSDKYIQKLKAKGYPGLIRFDELERFLKFQKYCDVLKFLWSEDSQSTRVSWLKQHAPLGHAILMLELFRENITQPKPPEEYICEAVKWFCLGLLCTDLDTACNTDISSSAAIDALKLSYFSIVPSDLKETVNKKISEMQLEICSTWIPKDTNPSPQWVLAHGMNSTIFLKDESKWLELRKEKHMKFLESLRDPSSQSSDDAQSSP